MSEFDELWKFATRHGEIVQEHNELEHIYNLMKACDCQTYLEVGTAEGNSLYVLGHATKMAAYIDLGEPHTKAARDEAIGQLTIPIQSFIGDSTMPEIATRIRSEHDCVFIDGGHDFATVLSDSILYAPLAKKYVFWHDIQLPEVRKAVEWFVKRWKLGKYSTFINSNNYGYGIIEVGK